MSFVSGVIAALAAPLLMVLGFMIWDSHWSGSAFSLNMFKCNVASIGFLILSVWTRPRGSVLSPEIFTTESVGYLMLSSTIGLLVGDWTWLEGMRVLGARKVIVLDSLKPFFASLAGKIFLNEHLKPSAFAGLSLTAFGVLLVALEKSGQDASALDGSNNGQHQTSNGLASTPTSLPSSSLPSDENTTLLLVDQNDADTSYAEIRRRKVQSKSELCYGLVMGVLNVLFHTIGVLITRLYGTRMNTWEINLVRFGFAGAVMSTVSVVLLIYSQLGTNAQSATMINNGDIASIEKPTWYKLPAMKLKTCLRILAGIVFVSFANPGLTNYAVFQIPLAVLLTLESIGPIYSVIFDYIFTDETPSRRATGGAILAVMGIIVLSSHA